MIWSEYKDSDAVIRAKNRLKRELTHGGFQGWRDAVSLAQRLQRALERVAQDRMESTEMLSIESQGDKLRVRIPTTLLPPPMRGLPQGRWMSVFMTLDWLAGIAAWADLQATVAHEEDLERAGRLLDNGWALVYKRPGRRFRATFVDMNEKLPDLVWEFLQRIDRGELALEDAQRGDYFMAPVIDFGWPALPDTSISKEAVVHRDAAKYDGPPEDEAALRQAAANIADTQSTAALIQWVEENWRDPRLAAALRDVEERWRRRHRREAPGDRPPPGMQRELFGMTIEWAI